MKVFIHHIYEYEKGLRNLILHTTSSKNRMEVIKKLEKRGISYKIYSVNEEKINVFFGSEAAINVVETMNLEKLNLMTDEEDFILGIMLGYDRMKQCERFIFRKNENEKIETLIG